MFVAFMYGCLGLFAQWIVGGGIAGEIGMQVCSERPIVKVIDRQSKKKNIRVEI